MLTIFPLSFFARDPLAVLAGAGAAVTCALSVLGAVACIARWLSMALNPDFPVTLAPKLLNAVTAIARSLAIPLVPGRRRPAPVAAADPASGTA
ncbi:MAG: hypothetical protein K9G59_08645 [Caulobacter sp.]|nr:hypothetical protein [Caulobacter sp.]